MNSYVVSWSIDIEAESAEDAAREALKIQRDPASTATVFDVTAENGKSAFVDVGRSMIRDLLYCCCYCGSTRVQVTAWIDPNANDKVIGIGAEAPSDDGYCARCGDQAGVMILERVKPGATWREAWTLDEPLPLRWKIRQLRSGKRLPGTGDLRSVSQPR